jgi:hypothetical protein
VFRNWQQIYNFERPHAALKNKCPAEIYSSSPRPFLESIPTYDYNLKYRLYRINNWGFLDFENTKFLLARHFAIHMFNWFLLMVKILLLSVIEISVLPKIDVQYGQLLSRKAHRLSSSV